MTNGKGALFRISSFVFDSGFWFRHSGFSLLVLLFYTFMALVPLYLMLVSSLTRLGTSFDLSSLDWFPRDFAWRNFSEFFHLMQNSPWKWLQNTLIVALPTTLVGNRTPYSFFKKVLLKPE